MTIRQPPDTKLQINEVARLLFGTAAPLRLSACNLFVIPVEKANAACTLRSAHSLMRTSSGRKRWFLRCATAKCSLDALLSGCLLGACRDDSTDLTHSCTTALAEVVIHLSHRARLAPAQSHVHVSSQSCDVSLMLRLHRQRQQRVHLLPATLVHRDIHQSLRYCG